jgi:putative FmdB family regulatory protein
MPIYAYKCGSCGFAKDILQKMSDPALEVCPACSQPTFSKQLTAAGFQLKGSGWYATDFKGGGGTTTAPSTDGTSAAPASSSTDTPAASSSATGCAPSCACH